ncbi:MAG: helix-turn-helix transcriptional regulator [Minicystis sp.]
MRESTALDVQKEVGRRIHRARVDAGMTQDAAAAAAGIDLKRWQRLEQGSVNATVKTLVRVAEALGISFWDLLVAASPEGESQRPRVRRSRA